VLGLTHVFMVASYSVIYGMRPRARCGQQSDSLNVLCHPI